MRDPLQFWNAGLAAMIVMTGVVLHEHDYFLLFYVS